MAIKDHPAEATYREFLDNGGQVRFVIEPKDIDSTRGFEESALFKPHLDTGFSVEPTPALFYKEQWGAVALYGGEWTGVIYAVYYRKGTITYKRISPDLYEAVCVIPEGSGAYEVSAPASP